MKKAVKVFCLLGFILLTFSNGLAQERTITEEELTKILDKAENFLKTQPYRLKTISENFRNGSDSPPDWTNTYVYEKNAEGYRRVSNIKTDGNNEMTEEIAVNKRKFTRKNNEAWKDTTDEELPRRIGVITKIVEQEKSIEFKYIGKETFKGKKYDLYEKKTISKIIANNNNYKSVYTNKFWFDVKGRFYKEETITEKDGELLYRSRYEYEYDPNIKIEVPIK